MFSMMDAMDGLERKALACFFVEHAGSGQSIIVMKPLGNTYPYKV